MSSSASFKNKIKNATILVCVLTFLANNKTAFAQPQVSVRASFIKTDFSSSTATMIDVEDETYLITFKLFNTGDLISKDTTVSLLMPVGWEYRETSGTIRNVTVNDSPYGQVMQLEVPPLGKNQKKEVGVIVKRTDDKNKEALYATISSVYSQTVNSKIIPKAKEDTTLFFSSQIKSGFQHLWMMMRELWSRFLLAIRYT